MRLTEKFQIDDREQAQRKGFVEFAHEDITLLRDLRPLMEKHVDGIVERFAGHPTVRQFVPLSARFTALVDMAERMDTAHMRTGEAR